MNTLDNILPAVRPRVPTESSPFPLAAVNDFALWRLRAYTLHFRPEAWQCVERLKAVCAAELLAHRASNMRTIARFDSQVAATPTKDAAR
jgi:hypothetical protein